GMASMRPVRPSTMPPKPKPTATLRLGVTCQVGSIVPANRSPDSPPDCDAAAYWNDARIDQRWSSRSPTRMVGPISRPLGAPRSPISRPYTRPRPSRKPLVCHATRSAWVGSDSRGSPSSSEELAADGVAPAEPAGVGEIVELGDGSDGADGAGVVGDGAGVVGDGAGVVGDGAGVVGEDGAGCP